MRGRRTHLQRRDEDSVQMLEVLVVDGTNVERANLRQALQGHVAELQRGEELEQRLHQRALEDVPQRHPRQVRVQRRERRLDQQRLLRVRQHVLA